MKLTKRWYELYPSEDGVTNMGKNKINLRYVGNTADNPIDDSSDELDEMKSNLMKRIQRLIK